MKRIKIGIALMTITLLLGSASVVTATPAPNHKVPQVRTHNNKSTHHQAKSQASKLTVRKSAKIVKATKHVKSAKLAKTVKSAKTTKAVKPATTKLHAKKSTAHQINT